MASSDIRTGFTGHEHDDELGLINMKGLLYETLYAEGEWAKMQHGHARPDGSRITIHYWQNLKTGLREGFKFNDD